MTEEKEVQEAKEEQEKEEQETEKKEQEVVTIFGYGSLLSPASAAATMPSLRNHRAGTLRSWRRVFSLVSVSAHR